MAAQIEVPELVRGRRARPRRCRRRVARGPSVLVARRRAALGGPAGPPYAGGDYVVRRRRDVRGRRRRGGEDPVAGIDVGGACVHTNSFARSGSRAGRVCALAPARRAARALLLERLARDLARFGFRCRSAAGDHLRDGAAHVGAGAGGVPVPSGAEKGSRSQTSSRPLGATRSSVRRAHRTRSRSPRLVPHVDDTSRPRARRRAQLERVGRRRRARSGWSIPEGVIAQPAQICRADAGAERGAAGGGTPCAWAASGRGSSATYRCRRRSDLAVGVHGARLERAVLALARSRPRTGVPRHRRPVGGRRR